MECTIYWQIFFEITNFFLDYFNRNCISMRPYRQQILVPILIRKNFKDNFQLKNSPWVQGFWNNQNILKDSSRINYVLHLRLVIRKHFLPTSLAINYVWSSIRKIGCIIMWTDEQTNSITKCYERVKEWEGEGTGDRYFHVGFSCLWTKMHCNRIRSSGKECSCALK